MNEKRERGRPRIDNPNTETLTIRINKIERTNLEKLALRQSMSLGSFIRFLIIKETTNKG